MIVFFIIIRMSLLNVIMHRFRPEFLAKAAQLVLETDVKIKTSVDDPERLLELLILQLAQEAMA